MFRVLVADPPWKFADSLPGETRGAIRHYKTMSVEDIVGFRCRPSLTPRTSSSGAWLRCRKKRKPSCVRGGSFRKRSWSG